MLYEEDRKEVRKANSRNSESFAKTRALFTDKLKTKKFSLNMKSTTETSEKR